MWRDVQNSSASSSSGFGVGFGVSFDKGKVASGDPLSGTLTPIVNMPAREGESGATRATVTPGTLELSDQRQDLASLNRDAGAAHVSVEAYDIARLKARQEGAAALSELLNGLTGDLSVKIGLKDGDPAKAALHAAVGAAVAAVAGTDIGAGAAAGLAQELIGAAVNDVLMSNPQLTQAQRNALSQWAAAALGSVIGGASGAAAALDADRFNRQLHMAEADLIRANAARYAVEQGYCESIAACDAEAVSRATLELTSETLRGVSDDFDYLEVNSNARAFLNGLAQAGQQVDGQTLFGELDRKGSEYRNSLINISTVLQVANMLGLRDTREGRTMLTRAYALAADEIGPHFNEVGRNDVLSLLSGMNTLAREYEAELAKILSDLNDPKYAGADPWARYGELSASASRLRNMIKIAVVRGSGHFTFTEKLGGGGPETRIMAQAYAENLASSIGGLDLAMATALRNASKNALIGGGKGAGTAPGNAEKGVLTDANFAQNRIKSDRSFSPDGQKVYSELAGKPIRTVDELADALKTGIIKPSQLPVDYVDMNGTRLILNTRTSTALEQAGIPRNQWFGRNQTGIEAYPGKTFNDLAADQLKNNKLPPTGADKLKWVNP